MWNKYSQVIHTLVQEQMAEYWAAIVINSIKSRNVAVNSSLIDMRHERHSYPKMKIPSHVVFYSSSKCIFDLCAMYVHCLIKCLICE